MPAHLSANKAKRVEALMSGEQKLMLQETRGIESDPNEPQFPLVFLEKMFDKKNRYRDLPYRGDRSSEIHVCVDPNAGGISNYAIVSFVEIDNRIVVVGIENKDAKDPMEQQAILIGHIKNLIERKEFNNHVIVLAVESNLGFEAHHHEEFINQENLQQRVCVLHESHQRNVTEATVGIHTTAASKHTNAFLTRYNLQEGRYAIADYVTCVSGTAEKVIGQLMDQLAVFSKITEPPKTLGGKARILFTGKHVNGSDDLSMAFQFYHMSRGRYNSILGRSSYRYFHETTERRLGLI